MTRAITTSRAYVKLAKPDAATLAQGNATGGARPSFATARHGRCRMQPDGRRWPAPPPPPPPPPPKSAKQEAAGRRRRRTTATATASGPAIANKRDRDPLELQSARRVRADGEDRRAGPRDRRHQGARQPDALPHRRDRGGGRPQFGKGESAITARLPLMVRPSPPRFLNFGDTFELPVVVQNQTDAPMTVRLAVRATNAAITDGAGREVTVPPNDRVEVRFPAAAELAGTARFQIVGASGSATRRRRARAAGVDAGDDRGVRDLRRDRRRRDRAAGRAARQGRHRSSVGSRSRPRRRTCRR